MFCILLLWARIFVFYVGFYMHECECSHHMDSRFESFFLGKLLHIFQKLNIYRTLQLPNFCPQFYYVNFANREKFSFQLMSNLLMCKRKWWFSHFYSLFFWGNLMFLKEIFSENLCRWMTVWRTVRRRISLCVFPMVMGWFFECLM